MKRATLNGSALAVGLLLAACGSDKGTPTQKLTNGTTGPATGRTEAPAPLRIRNLDADAALVTALKGIDTRFTKEANCVQLQGDLPADLKQKAQVVFGGVACPAKSAGLEGKSVAFRLEVEPAPVVGAKEEKPKTGPQQGQAPKDRLYYLVLKGTPASGKQQVAIPDTRVGELLLRHVVEPVKPEPVGKPVGQGKQETGKQEIPVGQGKPTPIPVAPAPKPGQGQPPVGKAPAPTYREELVLTKLCSDTYASICKVELEQGLYRKLTLTKLPEAPVSTVQKGKPEQPVGKQEPVGKPPVAKPTTPAPQKPTPAPAPKQEPKQEKPVTAPPAPAPQQGPKPK